MAGGGLRAAAFFRGDFLTTQINYNMSEQLGGEHQVAHPHPLIRAVEVGLEAGQGAAEGHTAWDIMDIGAAAGG